MAAATDPAWLDGGRMLPLVEDFYTIQGEGFHAGKPAYFIRLGGCDVGCRWCDAKYTWNPKLYPPTDVRTVIDRATACPAQAIVITGGEPLLYPLGELTETRSFWKPRDRIRSAAFSTGCAFRPSVSSPRWRRLTGGPTS